MANPTTNFGWVMPNSADLVTDLPADFNIFGQGVDTSMAQLLGGTTGQVLSKTSGTNMAFTWVTTDDANAIQNAIVDAKGDLIGATADNTPARLAVGTNAQVLTADSTQSTGIKWATAASGALTLITTQALSSVTSQSINNCFSATYQNYMIIFSGYNATSANTPTMKLRVAGVDNSAGYYASGSLLSYANVTATVNDNSNSSWTSRLLGILDVGSTTLGGSSITMLSPFAAVNTAFSTLNIDGRTGGQPGTCIGFHNSATSFDGFTITNATAMTGTVRIYGLAN